MECPQCHFGNAAAAVRCARCDTPFDANRAEMNSGETLATNPSEVVSKGRSEAGSKNFLTATVALSPGTVLGTRYEILELLGKGGMGAVYKANDRELDRLVALKVIRSELASNPQTLHRFKQELILARKVTHKNVIRIFDLGEAEGIKFITMEYIAGQDLGSLVKQRGKLSVEEGVSIIEQVCVALEAAHAEGVVHRDLKPQNIMFDAHGKVFVMDFGIAWSTETAGMTMTGAIVGTPDYMSPEQVRGEHLDARSDLFTLGVIFYQLLTGDIPYKAETLQAAMFKRTKERPRPLLQVDPSLPRFLCEIATKCLEIDPQLRYQSAHEIIHDLEQWRAGTNRGFSATMRRRMRSASPSKWAALAAAVLVAVLVTAFFQQRFFPKKTSASTPAMSLAIIPFRNASGDRSLDWLGSSLADILASEVGKSPRVRAVSSERVGQILRDLRIPPDGSLDGPTITRLGQFSNADTVVLGQYAKFGEQIRIDATIQDLKSGRKTSLQAEAANEKDILPSIDRLAGNIRGNLDLAPAIIRELRGHSLKPSSTSLPAVRDYNSGLQLARQGSNLEAAKLFEAATKEDPEFALAYSQLGQCYAKLGQDNEAEQYSRTAVELSEKLPDQEKFLIQARQNEILKNYDKAIVSYENLAKASPNDPDVLFDLGRLQESAGSFDKARASFSRVLELDPKRVEGLLAMGRVEIEKDSAQSGIDYLIRAQSIAAELGNDEEKAMILQALGVAFSVLNKQEEALRNYQESLKIKRRLGMNKGIADSLEAIAQTENAMGQPAAALRDYQDTLNIRRSIGDKAGTGDVLNDLAQFYGEHGHFDQAMTFYKQSLQIQTEVGNENNRALALNNIGDTYLQKGDYEDARTYFTQALAIREKLKVPSEIADTLHNLAETSVKTAQYDQALTQYLRALELRRSVSDKRGAALESAALGTVFGYQGRYGAALSSEEDAVKGLRENQEHGFYMTEALSDYGKALTQIGRTDQARQTLSEAFAMAQDAKNPAEEAQILSYQGDTFFYQGDFKSAAPLYKRAQHVATSAGDHYLILLTKANLAKLALKQNGSAASTADNLRAVAAQAESQGLRYLSLECSLYAAEALIRAKNYKLAQLELQRTLSASEKLGLRPLIAQSHFLLSRALLFSGNLQDADNHSKQARRAVEEIRKEAGNDAVLKRADFSAILASSAG
jgi:tetratricopeptide (TPR) repeat protein/predicted Ser/Thr protein kinase